MEGEKLEIENLLALEVGGGSDRPLCPALATKILTKKSISKHRIPESDKRNHSQGAQAYESF